MINSHEELRAGGPNPYLCRLGFGAEGKAEAASGPASTPVEAGRHIFEGQNCLACHKVGSEGDSSASELADVGCRRSRAQLLVRTRARRAGTIMPPLPPNMPDEQLHDLVDYLLSRKGSGGK